MIKMTAKCYLIHPYAHKSILHEIIFFDESVLSVNPIPTGHGRNQPIYERRVTKSGRNRVNIWILLHLATK